MSASAPPVPAEAPRTLRDRLGSPFKQAQKVGKAFMLPIAILPAAGLLLGVGGALSNPTTVATYPILDNEIVQAIFTVMADAGTVVFSNLALLLSIGLCIGLAKRDKGTAALAGIVGYLVMTGSTASLLKIFDPEGQPIDTGIVGAFFFLAWPPIQNVLVGAGEGIAGLGAFGTFLYGFLLRLSGAVGLHHMIYPMFWYTPLGGTEVVAGASVSGAQNIFFAQLADPGHTGLYTEGTKYFAGRFATMMFGLPGACLAMYHCVPKGRRAKLMGLFLGVALTSFITGITEPIEYMFLFVAPLLYVFHAFLDGLSFLIADLLQIRIGNTFSGGVIDFMLFGVFQGEARTHWLYVIPIGLIWFGLYYVSFRFFITKFNLKTPGRTDEEVAEAASEAAAEAAGTAPTAPVAAAAPIGDKQAVARATSLQIIEALGGQENLEDVDACITRLRVSVHDPAKVDKQELKRLGAIDVLEVAGGVQAVYGGKAVIYKSHINEIIGHDD